MSYKYFRVYREFFPLFRALSDEQRGKLILAIIDYTDSGDLPSSDDVIVSALASTICERIRVDFDGYDRMVAVGTANLHAAHSRINDKQIAEDSQAADKQLASSLGESTKQLRRDSQAASESLPSSFVSNVLYSTELVSSNSLDNSTNSVSSTQHNSTQLNQPIKEREGDAPAPADAPWMETAKRLGYAAGEGTASPAAPESGDAAEQRAADYTPERDGNAGEAPKGVCGNIAMSGEEWSSLLQQYPADAVPYLNQLSRYKKASGKTYASDAQAIALWIERDRDAAKKKSAPQGSFNTDEFFDAAKNREYEGKKQT